MPEPEEGFCVIGDCPFARIPGPLKNYGDAVVFEPLRPVVAGHVLVVPRRHVSDIGVDAWTSGDIMETTTHYIQDAGIEDCNVITSRGPAATQTVPHLHVHVVPRRTGDGLALPWTTHNADSEAGRE